MGREQDIQNGKVYMRRADRRLGKQRHLIARSANKQTVADTRDLVAVLSILRANVKRRHDLLQAKGDRSTAIHH